MVLSETRGYSFLGFSEGAYGGDRDSGAYTVA